MNNNVNRKYLYFWINQYRRLDDFDETKGFLFDDLGLNLSSEYVVRHTYKKNEISFEVSKNEIFEKNEHFIEDFYSENLIDIKAFVGNNGAGKTTLMRLVSDIISGKDYHQNDFEYVIIYTDYEKEENGKGIIYYFKNFWKNSPTKLIENPELTLDYIDEIKAPLTVFYSPSFYGIEAISNDRLVDSKNYKDISTNVLLLNSKESFTNPKTYARKYYSSTNQLFYYSVLEQNRLVDFLLNAGDDFFQILPVPQTIKMQPSAQSVELAIADLSVKIVQTKNFFEIVENDLNPKFKEKWNKLYLEKLDEWAQYNIPHRPSEKSLAEIPEVRARFDKEFKYNQDELVEDVKKSWVHYYNSNREDSIDDSVLSKALNEQFRFAALMSYTRTFYTSSHVKEVDDRYDKYLDLNLSLKELWNLDTLENARFWNVNKDIKEIGERIERIINLYDGINKKGFATHENHFFQNGYIVFDLNKHKSILKDIHGLYTSVFKLTDFISFSFTRPLSSGEDQFLRFYSRFFASMRDVSIDKPIEKIFLFVDEGELCLHPEWQRKWLNTFIKLMAHIEHIMQSQYDNNGNQIISPDKKLRVQLFFATHSPFMLTDLFDSNIIKLKRDNFGSTKCIQTPEKTIAGDINGLLRTGFFLNGTLGEFMEEKIKSLLQRIQENGITDEDKIFIDNIGNPIMRALLRQELNKVGAV